MAHHGRSVLSVEITLLSQAQIAWCANPALYVRSPILPISVMSYCSISMHEAKAMQLEKNVTPISQITLGVSPLRVKPQSDVTKQFPQASVPAYQQRVASCMSCQVRDLTQAHCPFREDPVDGRRRSAIHRACKAEWVCCPQNQAIVQAFTGMGSECHLP